MTWQEELAKRFHEAYERLAPSFGYTTREASAKPWAEVPENNLHLMAAVVGEVLEDLDSILDDDTDSPTYDHFVSLYRGTVAE